MVQHLLGYVHKIFVSQALLLCLRDLSPIVVVGWASSSIGVGLDGSTWGEGIFSKSKNYVPCTGPCSVSSVFFGALWWL
jgi:hypothetical protein